MSTVLEYIHSKHMIHRDIKPDNIILRHHDGKPVLIDFGAVRESMGTVLNSQGNPTSSIVIGTPGFMPSEQAAGRPVYSSDLYSLALTAIYLLTGRIPQQLETDARSGEIIWPDQAFSVSPRLATVIQRAIAYHPRDRYSTAREMLDSLQSITYPIPPTLPVFTQTPSGALPQVPPSPPATVPVSPNVSNQGNNQNSPNSIVLGSLIAGGLIGASVIISQVLLKSAPPASEKTVSSAIKNTQPILQSPESPSSVISQVKQTPVNSSPTETQSNTKPQIIVTRQFTPAPITPSTPLSIPPINSTTANDYSWLSQRLVTDADLDGKDGFELDIMRNSIFARQGRRFDTPGIQSYFNQQPWYHPRYSPKEFSSQLLTKLDQQNVEYISKYQDRYNLRYFKK